MLILHEGELLHTDSSTDILEHYGVKGMKWGKRLRTAATNVSNYYDHTNRMNRRINNNIYRRDITQKKLDSLNKEMATRSNFRKLRGKTAASHAALYGITNFGKPANMALGAAFGGASGAVAARKINRDKRSKLVGALNDTNVNIAKLEYKRDSRINKKSYKNDSKHLKSERNKSLNSVDDKQERKRIKKEYASKLRKNKNDYKDNKYATRERFDRFYDYNHFNKQ